MDGWASANSFVVHLGESPFSTNSCWKTVWDEHVTIVVSLLTSVAKDDLGMLSDTRHFGDISVTLSSEDMLPEYTIRTMKVLL